MDLLTLRDQLDEIDAQMVALFEKRMEICGQVADYKIENGRNVLDRQREQEKISKVVSQAHNDFNRLGVKDLFEQIMAMSRKLQYQKLTAAGVEGRLPFTAVEGLDTKGIGVVFQGAEGAYSQEAMKRYFGEDVKNYHVDTFRDAMGAIEEGWADFAVLPIENSTAGAVNEIYDLLVEFENYIVDELVLPIEHCLLGLPGAKIEDIKTVYSHPQSLMQSARYLGDHNWQQISMQNNAFAARMVAQSQDLTKAAVAGEYAGKVYGLEVLKKGINHAEGNSTRFIIVTNRKIFRQDARKISLCLEIPHESGSLHHILSHFIYNGLNMTKIESRPIPSRNWEYRFFIDFEGNFMDSSVRNALRGLREEALNMKVLGNY